jgi:hypothetical protein
MQLRLHKQYGFGLPLLRQALRGAPVAPDNDPSNNQGNKPKKNADGTQTYNGILLNPADQRTFVLGTVAGLQYNNKTYGRCFYATLDTVNFLDYFDRDFKQLFVDFSFYTLFVYDPVHFYGNLVACYE